MADIPCGDKILDYLVLPALKKLLHPVFCFQRIVDEFQEQNRKLSIIQEHVGNNVQRARDNARVINENVQTWLDEVIGYMPEVQRVESELKKNKSCCFRYSWCPNWTCHYKFSTQVSDITATMKTLCANGELFNTAVSHTPPLHQDNTASSSTVPFVHSRSSKSAFDQIMEALKRDDVNLIGLYGGVGTGKTSVAKQVAVEAKAIFQRVIWVHVSQKPDVRRVQGLIADFLNLSLEQLESDQARATTLKLRLKNGEKNLIILDDVSEDFNLGEVGIPTIGCKLLLTAYAKVQVPNSMHTQRDVELGTLSEDEAWTLFESVAKVQVPNEVRMRGAAKDALAECCGLPKAVVAIGTALKGKGVPEWAETLQQLKKAKFKIIESLKKDVEKLSLKQDRVNSKIKKAKENVHEVYSDVEKWLKDVETIIYDVEQFDNELNKNKWCFDEGDVANKVGALEIFVKDLYAEGNFDQVSHPTPLVQDMILLSSQGFMFSKAAESALNQIMEALKADDVRMIGMYGMGGIGKTTLANQVQSEVVRKKIFDRSVMVTVSQKPDVENMQDKIAEVLGFSELKQTNTLDGRAHKLCERLENENILIILDDVWKPFDMRTIGITLNNCKSCKVIMTTRRRDMCSSMNCQPEIQLNLFSEDESQNFFKTKAGLSGEFILDDVARQIVEECKYLPIALETVATALKNKGKDEWTEALEKLRNARLVDIMGVDDDDKNAYKCVKVSYDYLKGQTQIILLLCSIFPEDYKIVVEDLTRYAFGMELFERVRSIEDARRKVRVAVRFLKDSCLLLDSRNDEYVKMHDVVRDSVLWIGGTESQEKKVLTVRDNEDLKELIKKKSFQNCRAVSFMPDVIPRLSTTKMLECPNLEAALIFSNGKDVELGEEFFVNMQLLKVLNIKGGGILTMCKFAIPQSLHRLEYLRALMLRYCECSNSCILRELRSLRILSLDGCQVDGVVEMAGLKKLRLLELYGLEDKEGLFSFNVIERFIKLEELHGYRVGKCKVEEGTNNNLSELLSNLVALSVQIKDVRCLPKNFCFPDMTDYWIRVGPCGAMRSRGTKQARLLEVVASVKDESVCISICKKLLPTVQDLLFEDCNDLSSLDSFNSRAEGFLQRLESLEVKECDRMEWMFEFQGNENISDSTIRQLQFLKTLKLCRLVELKHIWKGPTGLVSLCNLTKVEIDRCQKLICIFSSPSLATSMRQLESLMIWSCPDLEEIITMKGGGHDDDFSCCCCFANLRELSVSRCDKLKAIFPIVKSTGRAPHLHPQSRCRLPKLQSFSLYNNERLEHIFGHQTEVECPSLQELDVSRCPNIQFHVSLPKPSKDDSRDNIQALEQQLQRRHDDLSQCTIICSSSLKRVNLLRCNKLKQVLTISPGMSSSQLKKLDVVGCNNLEQVINKVEDGKEALAVGVCLENLKALSVSNCGKLKTICPITIALPKLESLELKSNAEMEHVFGKSDWDYSRQSPFLENLCVDGCPKLCTLFAVYTQNMSIAKTENITFGDIKGVEEITLFEREKDTNKLYNCHLKTVSLLNLVNLECIWRGPTQNIFFERLYRLEVIGCNRLKHLWETAIATNTILSQLEELIVERCNELEKVIIVSDDGKERHADANGIVFKKLRILKVIECGKIKTIFPISTALPKLERLALINNGELEHVFGQSDWDCTWPFLEDLYLERCPKVCTQWIQNLSTTKEMKTIEIDEESIQIQSQGNSLLTFHLKTLCLRNAEELKCIWVGPTHNIWFKNLVQIEVIDCNKLKHIFATPIATSLPCLTKLTVQRCNELEQVMMVGDAKGELIGFERLQFLKVGNCEKLKTIFTVSIPLPNLNCLLLESNAELESIWRIRL